MTWLWVLLAVLLVGAVWLFNACVRLRNRAREAFSGVDVQLKRRHDLVPNIVKTVQAYARHEQETLESVIAQRGAATTAQTVPARAESESGLRQSLDKLLLLVEKYPELKADENFRRLHGELVEIEDHLQYARRYYNGAVRDYNNRIQTFPANVLVGLWGFTSIEFFQLDDDAEREAPRV